MTTTAPEPAVVERPARVTAEPGGREITLALVGAYLLLVTFYAWQAWRRETPTIFSDELELTQISRAIAETGQPARRGAPYGFTTLVPWLTAPFWWISNVAVAYEALKYAQTLVMALAVFPAFWLARMVVTPPWALFAAVGTIAAPALSYAPILVEEPFAYPAAALALWLTVRAVDRPTLGRIALAAGAGILGAAIRSQLVVLLATLGLALLAHAWGSPRWRTWRGSWTRWDWAGAGALAVGAVLFVFAAIGNRSHEWATVHATFKERILEYGSWAAGAFALGVGVVPVIALLAVLAVPARERARPGMRAFVLVSGAAVLSFGYYAAVKGAYVSTTFSSLIVERNLVYLTPLAFTATAVVLARAAAPTWALVTSGVVVVALVMAIPLGRGIDSFPYYEAHGLSILALFNRELAWPVARIETAVVVLVVVATALLVARRLVTGPASAWLALGLAVGVLAWNLTNETYASIGAHDQSSQFERNLPDDKRWVDTALGPDGKVTIYAQQVTDPNGINLYEFWNRSIKAVWSVEGSAPGPGPTQTPDLAEPDGTLRPRPETDHVLTVNGVEIVGDVVARASEKPGSPELVRIGEDFRMRSNQVGVYSDGWMGEHAAYNRFDVSEDGPGYAVVSLDRKTACYEGVKLPGFIEVRIGPIGVGRDKQPAIERVTGSKSVYLPTCGTRTVVLPAPPGPWRVEVDAQTFVPKEVDPRLSESRELGAVVGFEFVPA